jgi:hypothetical protein
MEVLQLNKTKLETWTLLQKSKEEQVQWFKDTYTKRISDVTLQNDVVEEIIVVDELFETANAALADLVLPEDFPVPAGIDREKVVSDFKEYGANLNVRVAPIEHLAIQDPAALAEEEQFVRIITNGMKVRSYIEHWDAAISFTDSLRQTGSPVNFTFEEKKLIFGIIHGMNCVASTQAKQVQTSGTPQMYRPE